MTKPRAIILEIDGVLSDDSHRRHFIECGCCPDRDGCIHDYEAYHAACDKDGVNEWCVELLQRMAHSNDSTVIDFEIIFISRRPEKYWQISFEWIRENLGGLYFNSDFIFMRPDFFPCGVPGNHICTNPYNRPSHKVKREIYEREVKDKYDVLFVLERSGPDAEMYRELKLTVLEVK